MDLTIFVKQNTLIMKIGIIGTGQIGQTLIRQYAKAGHRLKITNACSIDKSKALEAETGAKAVSLSEVVNDVDVLVISIPFIEIPKLAKALGNSISDNTIIIDTTNYYPIRDGQIEEIENGMLESVWVSKNLARPVVKVYNSILAGSLAQSGHPKGTFNRIVLPVSGNNTNSKDVVTSLVNDSGFDTIDIGNLSDSWKQQPGSPIYCTNLTLQQLKRNLNVDQSQLQFFPERRELSVKFIFSQDLDRWLDWWEECMLNNRIIFKTDLTE